VNDNLTCHVPLSLSKGVQRPFDRLRGTCILFSNPLCSSAPTLRSC